MSSYFHPFVAGLFLLIFPFQVCWAQVLSEKPDLTFCNPLSLNYRFCLDEPSRREAADPVIVLFKNEYFLFASKSGGYWRSTDLVTWNFITTQDLPLENYAPTAVVIDNEVYFTASTENGIRKIYKTADPTSGKWQIANNNFPLDYTDPDLFLDDTGRLYFYFGCSNVNPIYGVELDRKTLMPIGEPIACFNENSAHNGWERPGDHNERKEKPWTEGAWMTKFRGKYYLQYSTPGTEFRSYCDGVYVADTPLGPFRLLMNNPFSYKPGGFVTAAGHSGTFQDRYGNYWHITTTTISVKHKFERRLSLFPAFFGDQEKVYTYTEYGDYPLIVPQRKTSREKDFSTGWMLLSYQKPVTASSFLPDHPANLACDEDMRTYWSAQSGKEGEWVTMDLRHPCTLHAIQVNFADHQTNFLGRKVPFYYQYRIDYSMNGKSWKLLVQKSDTTIDQPHDYRVLDLPVTARYLKITNLHTPSGMFALSDLRVFGKGNDQHLPAKVSQISVNRSVTDRCSVQLEWQGNSQSTGYTIRFGRTRDQLYLTYQVYGQNSLTINSLTDEGPYYFTIDSFNEQGITRGTKLIDAP